MTTGKIRVYTDHTGRNYQDYTKKEYDENFNTPELCEIRQLITDEIDREIIKRILAIE